MVARLAVLVVLLLVVAGVCVVRPRLPASWLARGWRALGRGGLLREGQEPLWVVYYLGDLPPEDQPSEARALEEWVRALGAVLLALPVILLLAMLVLSP